MAVPSSSTPSRASAARVSRRFTLQQATRALPLVRRIVADLVKTNAHLSACREVLETTRDAHQIAQVQGELDYTRDRMEQLIDELMDIGVDLKDVETGLVDFVGQHEGRDVCLCWRLGEEQISHWHELNAGFAGRKPVSLLRES